MAEKLNEMQARLAELNEKRGKLDAAIEEMIGDMADRARAALGRRLGAQWAEDPEIPRADQQPGGDRSGNRHAEPRDRRVR
jgi:hypothetical protein